MVSSATWALLAQRATARSFWLRAPTALSYIYAKQAGFNALGRKGSEGSTAGAGAASKFRARAEKNKRGMVLNWSLVNVEKAEQTWFNESKRH